MAAVARSHRLLERIGERTERKTGRVKKASWESEVTVCQQEKVLTVLAGWICVVFDR